MGAILSIINVDSGVVGFYMQSSCRCNKGQAYRLVPVATCEYIFDLAASECLDFGAIIYGLPGFNAKGSLDDRPTLGVGGHS